MNHTIFEFKDHYSYLLHKLDKARSKRGIKTKLSEFLQIQPAFLSQVLSKKYSLSLEQAEKVNRFFYHSSEESNFFILLVSRDKAGTTQLQQHYQSQIENILKKRLLVVERLGKKYEISSEEKGIYYSSWMYSAIHIACTIPELKTCKDISGYLGISSQQCLKVLDYLVNIQLLKKSDDHYSVTNSWARLDNSSPYIVKHHSNWRQKSIQSLDNQNDEDLHYSGVYSMSHETAHKIKDSFLSLLKQQTKEIELSREEDLYVVGVDFFKLLAK